MSAHRRITAALVGMLVLVAVVWLVGRLGSDSDTADSDTGGLPALSLVHLGGGQA